MASIGDDIILDRNHILIAYLFNQQCSGYYYGIHDYFFSVDINTDDYIIVTIMLCNQTFG